MKQDTRSKPFISILMTVYNNEKYFPIAVRNIARQDFKDWELIIVDDCSTDNTGKIADSLAMTDERISVIHHEKNLWLYAALNHAIERARGDYIFVHNSDDTIEAGSLSLMADRAKKYDADIVWVPVLYHTCDASQNIIEYDFTKFGKFYRKEQVFLSKQDVENNWTDFWQKSLSTNQVNLYRTSLMKKYRFAEDMFIADALFNIDIADEIKVAVTLGKSVYNCFRYIYQEDMNASFGKWYDNEHEMYNFKHQKMRELLKKWRRPTSEFNYWDEQRILDFNTEINSLINYSDKYSASEKISMIKSFCRDSTFWECVVRLSRKDELKEKIIADIDKLTRFGDEKNIRYDSLNWEKSVRQKNYGVCPIEKNLNVWSRKSHQFDELGYCLNKRKRIYIYGAGDIGYAVFNELSFLNCVDAFIDRSELKQKNGICGIKIIDPREIYEKHDTNHFILLAVENDAVRKVMEHQMLMAGYIKGVEFDTYKNFMPSNDYLTFNADELNFCVFCLYAHNVIWLHHAAFFLNDNVVALRQNIDSLFKYGVYVRCLNIFIEDETQISILEDTLRYIFNTYKKDIGRTAVVVKCNNDMNDDVMDISTKFQTDIIFDVGNDEEMFNKEMQRPLGCERIKQYTATPCHWLSREVDESALVSDNRIIKYHKVSSPSYHIKNQQLIICWEMGSKRCYDLCQDVTTDSRRALAEFLLGYGDEGKNACCQECYG